MEQSGSGGNADSRTRPNTQRELRARAIKDGRQWRLTELTLELTSTDEHIDLLGKTNLIEGDWF